MTKTNLNPILLRIFEDGAITSRAVSPDQIKKQEKDTFNHLDNAAKYAEYDCVTFGLETDDGAIVKVYVKTEDAEKFEEALSILLGQIDDIEEALNEISQEFNIIDVEWPDDDDESGEINDDALNAEIYDNEKESANHIERKANQVNKKIPNDDVTEGMRFARQDS